MLQFRAIKDMFCILRKQKFEFKRLSKDLNIILLFKDDIIHRVLNAIFFKKKNRTYLQLHSSIVKVIKKFLKCHS